MPPGNLAILAMQLAFNYRPYWIEKRLQSSPPALKTEWSGPRAGLVRRRGLRQVRHFRGEQTYV
jgi:hypothetical protein